MRVQRMRTTMYTHTRNAPSLLSGLVDANQTVVVFKPKRRERVSRLLCIGHFGRVWPALLPSLFLLPAATAAAAAIPSVGLAWLLLEKGRGHIKLDEMCTSAYTAEVTSYRLETPHFGPSATLQEDRGTPSGSSLN